MLPSLLYFNPIGHQIRFKHTNDELKRPLSVDGNHECMIEFQRPTQDVASLKSETRLVSLSL